MTKNEWFTYRERAVHKDLAAVNKAFGFYCEVKGLNPTAREMRVIQRNLDITALIRWVDIELGINTITKDGFVVKVF